MPEPPTEELETGARTTPSERPRARASIIARLLAGFVIVIIIPIGW